MNDRRVDAGGQHAREFSRPISGHLPALGEGAIGVGHVPIPGLGEDQTLRGLQPQRLDVVDEDQQAGEMLTAAGYAEFGRSA